MAIRPLSFIGDRDPPDPLSTVHARRPILGSGKLPKDLVEISKTRSYYVQAKERPSASIESLGKGNERVWQVSVPVGDDLRGAPGLTLRREKPDITPGDSGGPMFGWWGNDSRLVGVVSGEEEIDFLWWTVEKDNVMAGGSGFTSLAAWGRSNWPL